MGIGMQAHLSAMQICAEFGIHGDGAIARLKRELIRLANYEVWRRKWSKTRAARRNRRLLHQSLPIGRNSLELHCVTDCLFDSAPAKGRTCDSAM